MSNFKLHSNGNLWMTLKDLNKGVPAEINEGLYDILEKEFADGKRWTRELLAEKSRAYIKQHLQDTRKTYNKLP